MRSNETRELAGLESELRDPLAASAPQLYDAELDAIRARARAFPATSDSRRWNAGTGWWTRRRLTVSASLAAAVMVAAAVLGWGLAHTQTSAFATALAVDALLPQAKTLHLLETVTEVRSGLATHRPPLAEEYWIAPGATATRHTTRLASNGQLLVADITLGQGGHARFGTYEGSDQALHGATASSPSPTRETTPPLLLVNDQPVGADGANSPKEGVQWWLDLRADLKSGKAKVLGVETVGGERYWHVRSQDPTFMRWAERNGKWALVPGEDGLGAYKRTIDALLHEGDYLPKQAVITMILANGSTSDDRGVEHRNYLTLVSRFDILSWQEVTTSAVPSSTFDLDSIPATSALMASFQYWPNELRGFGDFGAWALPESARLTSGSATAKWRLDGGTIIYDRGMGSPTGSSSENFPPDGWWKLSDRYLHAFYVYNFADDKEVDVFIASMPKASETSVTAFLATKRAMGRPASGVVNGLRYRGVDTPGRTGGVVVVDAGSETLVIAYRAQLDLGTSPLKTLLPQFRRANP